MKQHQVISWPVFSLLSAFPWKDVSGCQDLFILDVHNPPHFYIFPQIGLLNSKRIASIFPTSKTDLVPEWRGKTCKSFHELVCSEVFTKRNMVQKHKRNSVAGAHSWCSGRCRRRPHRWSACRARRRPRVSAGTPWSPRAVQGHTPRYSARSAYPAAPPRTASQAPRGPDPYNTLWCVFKCSTSLDVHWTTQAPQHHQAFNFFL